MDTFGQHLLLDVWLHGAGIEESAIDAVSSLVRRRFRVVGNAEHAFVPQGLTRVFILAESHFTLHTYPESGYLSMDLYICDPMVDLEDFKNELLSLLPCAHAQSRTLMRGRKAPASQRPAHPQAEPR